MDGTVQAQKATAPGQPAVCAEETCTTAVAGDAGQQALDTQAPTAEVVEGACATTRRGPGRPRTIPTSHRCCPNEECLAYGRLGDDPLHDIVGCGTYTTTHGEVRQMYQCNVCGKPFSETAGTPFFGLKTPMKTVCIALQELAEGLGIRAVGRIHGVKPDTVLEWLKKVGQHCEMLSEYMMQDLNVTQVQLDELWTFVRKKERMLKEWEKLHSEWGEQEIQALLESVGQKINTSFVERINLTLRHLVSRLHRKTLCFSKKREYLVHHLHLALTYYHFTRYHASLRVKLPEPIPTRGSGSPKKWQQRTPAIAAGLTDHRWSLRELLMCPVPAAPG